MNIRLDTPLRRDRRLGDPPPPWILLVALVFALVLVFAALAARGQEAPPRPRPSRPIPPPTAIASYRVWIDRSQWPQAIHVIGTWQQPDGETAVYRFNQSFPNSGLGPGDHIVTEVDVPALADLVAVDAPDCNGGCGPYCTLVLDIVTMRHVCDCTAFPFEPTVPARTSNGAEPFMVANQTRRIVVAVRDRETGAQLGNLLVRDLSFTWADIGVFAAPAGRRRAAR